MEFFIKDNILNVVSNQKTTIFFDTLTKNMKINSLDITHPWEYEKWWILSSVVEFWGEYFYSFSIDSRHVVVIATDKLEKEDEIFSFFWDVDVLIIIWSKEAAQIFEKIEARIVIPYWDWKHTFLTSLWQKVEEVENYKLKWELPEDTSEFVNLSEE